MYELREFSAMPILADALQGAGCVNEGDRRSGFPAALFNGHLTAENSDVRAGTNYTGNRVLVIGNACQQICLFVPVVYNPKGRIIWIRALNNFFQFLS